MNDAFAIASPDAFGEDGFVGEVEIDHSLPQSVPVGLSLQVLLRVLVHHALHPIVQCLQLPPNATNLLLNAREFRLFLLLALPAFGEVIDGGVICPAGAFLALLEDAAQLGSA
jgi:hypothetical protein